MGMSRQGGKPRGVGLTADQRSPKPRVGVRIPPPLPVHSRLADPGSEAAWKVTNFSRMRRLGRMQTRRLLQRVAAGDAARHLAQPEAGGGTTVVVILTVFAFAGFFAAVDAIVNDRSYACIITWPGKPLMDDDMILTIKRKQRPPWTPKSEPEPCGRKPRRRQSAEAAAAGCRCLPAMTNPLPRNGSSFTPIPGLNRRLPSLCAAAH